MKKENNNDLILNDIPPTFTLNRRNFLKLLGGGIFIFFKIGDTSPLGQTRRRGSGRGEPTDFNAYLRIGEDGRVTCYTGKIEMGQGIITSLAQMLAEELDISLNSVDMVMGDTDLCPWDMGTFGSRSTKYFGPSLRRAAAEARDILLQMAADHLKTSRKNLILKEGIIFDKTNTKKSVPYSHLTKGKKIQKHLQAPPILKHYTKHSISGKPANRIDGKEKVTGTALFTGDIRPSDMLYAKILRPPVHGSKLKNVDTSEVRKIKGVKIIKDKDLIAVLHKYPDEAQKAIELIKAQFNIPETKVDNQTIFSHLLKTAPAGQIASQSGNLDSGKQLTIQTYNARYFNHYVAHAPIEPHTAVAKIEGNKATVWASTQTPFRARDAVARTLGLPASNVHVITPFVGGGFGGKTSNQQVIEAARLAKLTGKPVQVAWSREEEFFFDTFRPAAIIDIKSGLNKKNKITFWDYKIYFAGTRSSKPFYNIPHYRILSTGGWRGEPGTHPFRVGAWRGPGSNTNVFAIESHIDMLAKKAGMDPLSFRLENLRNKRMQRVLSKAAETFGKSFSKLPSGRGYGIACTDYLGTYVAAMAEVEVNKQTGTINIKRVVCAHDMGEIINPEGAKQQIEGGITMGLGYVLTEEVLFRGGEILNKNFDTYELPRFSWTPKIEVVLIKNPEMAPQGCGEPAITCMGGVIANAVFDATGIRMYQLPMTPERIKKALTESQ